MIIHFSIHNQKDNLKEIFSIAIKQTIIKINNEIENCKKHSIRKSVPDIIKFNYYRHTEGKINICKEKIEEGVYFSKNDIEMLLKKALNSTGDFWLSAWSHIYKREFLIKNGLEFVPALARAGSLRRFFGVSLLGFWRR